MTPADDLPALPAPDKDCLDWDGPYYHKDMSAYALAARAERDAEIERLKNHIKHERAALKNACDRAEAAEARVKELEETEQIAVERYGETVAHCDTLQARIAELEERLMVLLPMQLKRFGAMTDERLRQMLEDYRDAWSPGARDELFAQYRAELNQSVPSPDSPAPAPLAAQGVEGEPHGRESR